MENSKYTQKENDKYNDPHILVMEPQNNQFMVIITPKIN